MNRRTAATITAAALTALALTGCTAGTEPAEPTATATAAVSTPAPTVKGEAAKATRGTTELTPSETAKPTLTGQEWADAKVAQWWDTEGAENFTEFFHPFQLIESWESPAPGEIVLTVDPAISYTDEIFHDGTGPANDLWMIAAVMMDQLDREGNDADVESVTARTADGARSETITSADHAESYAHAG